MARASSSCSPLLLLLLAGRPPAAAAVREHAADLSGASAEESALLDQALEALGRLQEAVEGFRARSGSAAEEASGSGWNHKLTGPEGVGSLTSKESETAPPNFAIYLDAPAEERWKEVAAWHAREEGGRTLLSQMLQALGQPDDAAGKMKFLGKRLLTEDSELSREIEGYAKAANENVDEIRTIQAIYAMLSSCTSIVAQAEDGSVVHGRLLDFHGQEVLRPRTFVAKWYAKQGDKVPLFVSAQFDGLMGVLTGMAKGFAVAVNQRNRPKTSTMKNWWSSVMGGQNVAMTVRQVLTECQTFDCAATKFSEQRLVAPAYITLAGTKAGEGLLLQRGRMHSDCIALEGFTALQGCATAPHGWFLAVGNADAEQEKHGGLAYSRRNMALRAVSYGSRACKEKVGGDCRASAQLLELVLRWGMVTQHTTTYRTFMKPQHGNFAIKVVEQQYCGKWKGCYYPYGLSGLMSRLDYPNHQEGKAPGLYGALPSVSECTEEAVQGMGTQCEATWAETAEKLAEDYMQVSYGLKPTGYALSSDDLTSCPCGGA